MSESTEEAVYLALTEEGQKILKEAEALARSLNSDKRPFYIA